MMVTAARRLKAHIDLATVTVLTALLGGAGKPVVKQPVQQRRD